MTPVPSRYYAVRNVCSRQCSRFTSQYTTHAARRRLFNHHTLRLTQEQESLRKQKGNLHMLEARSCKLEVTRSSTLQYCQRFCLSIQSRSKHLGEDKRRVSAQRLLRASSTGLRITVVKSVRQNKSKACATLVDKACNHPSGRQISKATPPTRVRFIPKLSHCNPCTDQETTQETNRKHQERLR